MAGGGGLSRDDWRRDNVNRMISSVYSLIKATRPDVKFSISPFGIYRPGHPEGMPPPITGLDPYTELYADSKLWLENGWLDIFSPQLYWSIASTGQSYPVLLDWWLDNNPQGRYIYAATGVYKIDDSNNWPVSEIVNQVEISRDPARRAQFSLGNIHYSAQFFRDNTKGITDTFRTTVYTNKATVPAMAWMGLPIPAPPQGVTVTEGGVVTWDGADSDSVRWWVIAKMEGGSKWNIRKVVRATSGSVSSIKLEPGTYHISAANAAWQFSHEVRFQI